MDMCHYVIDTIDIYREPRRRGHTDLVHRESITYMYRDQWIAVTEHGGYWSLVGGGIVRKSLLLIDSTV